MLNNINKPVIYDCEIKELKKLRHIVIAIITKPPVKNIFIISGKKFKIKLKFNFKSIISKIVKIIQYRMTVTNIMLIK